MIDFGPWKSEEDAYNPSFHQRPMSLPRSIGKLRRCTPLRLRTETSKLRTEHDHRACLKLKRLRYPENLFERGQELKEIKREEYHPQVGTVHNNWQRRVNYLRSILGSRDLNVKNQLAVLPASNNCSRKVIKSNSLFRKR